MNKKSKVIAIVGQTAVGKTDLSIEIAKYFNGEVISVDARQVYKGLNIGSAKITHAEMRGVRHHMLDIVNPQEQYSVEQFKNKAHREIEDIVSRGNTPILVGGSAQYMDAVLYNFAGAPVPPDLEFRKKMEEHDCEVLYKEIKEKAPERAKELTLKNKRRLIRALEIYKSLGTIPKEKKTHKYDILVIGLMRDKEELRERIMKRIEMRFDNGGLQEEVKKLHNNGLSWERLDELGLEYRYVAKFLQGELSRDETKKQLFSKTWQYAKRQMTWWKRNKSIHWYYSSEEHTIMNDIKIFLEN